MYKKVDKISGKSRKKTKLTKKSKGLKHERVKHHDKSTYRNFKREKEEIGV